MNSDNRNSPEMSNNSQRNDWQSFSFLCDSTEPGNSQSEEFEFSDSGIFPLSQARVGDFVCIVEIKLNNSIDYLKNIGLTPGTVVEVISHTDSGSVILALNDKSFGFGADMARSILVMRNL